MLHYVSMLEDLDQERGLPTQRAIADGVCYSASLEQPGHGAATTPPTERCGVSQQGQRPAGHCALVGA